MLIAIYGKILNERSAGLIRRLLDALNRASAGVFLYRPVYDFLRTLPEPFGSVAGTFRSHSDLNGDVRFLISVGGDGTFLESVNIVRDSGIPVAGVNIGRLGFLSTIAEAELQHSVEKLLRGELSFEERTLLRVSSDHPLPGDFPYALNDVVVQKQTSGLITIHTWCDTDFLNSYWADGLIVATPTGSSAYSMSVGGPIVAPQSQNFIISPIAPHNLTVRPLVIPDHSALRLRTDARSGSFSLSLDSRAFNCPSDTEIEIKRAGFTIKTVQSSSFYATLRNKLMWGEDKRN
ncbi:MAG: NAD kinase [Bacteroidales bacterium]|jgi:NAD+ kinase|nr:NAD kinase [Bacteroidales bacterium]